MRRTRSVTGVQRKEVRLKKLERGEKKKRNMEEMKEKGRETRKMYHVYPAIDVERCYYWNADFLFPFF